MKKNNLKKFLLLFTCIVCLFSMTACSDIISSDKMKESGKKQEVISNASNIVSWCEDEIIVLDKKSDEEIVQATEADTSLSGMKDTNYVVNPDGMNVATVEFYNSWLKTREDLGSLESIDKETVDISSKTGTLCVVTVNTTYDKRKCTFKFTFDKDMNLASCAINPVYTIGEKMDTALLNTVLGMGTVFIVLIFISFIISLLRHVNKIGQNGNKEDAKETAAQGVDNAIAQIVSNEENTMDDLELVAVITAAIAASEGTSADGLVVRSIKKVNNRRK